MATESRKTAWNSTLIETSMFVFESEEENQGN